MNISNTQPAEERISDFGLVAALVTSGYGIRRTEQEGSRVFFIFEDKPELGRTVEEYWAGSLMVSARQYFDSTKMLKSRIHGSSNYPAKYANEKNYYGNAKVS